MGTFTDATYATITNLGTTNTNLTSLTTRVTTAESSLTGKQNALSVSSGITLSNNVLGYDSAIISTKASTDALATRVTNAELSITTLQTCKQDVITAGTGLSKSGATLSVNSAQTQITSVGTLSSLTVSGNVNINASSSTLTVGVANGTINLGDPGNASGKIQSDPNHAYYPRINYAGAGKAAFYAYGDMEFYNGGLIAAQTVRMTIQASGTIAIAKDLQVHRGINIPFTGHTGLDIGGNISFARCGAAGGFFLNAAAGDAIIRAIIKVVRIGVSGGNSILDIFDGGVIVNSGNLTVATAPTLGNHLVNKTYVDGSLTTTNTNVTNLTGRVVSLEAGGTTSKEITIWSKLKGSDSIPVILPPVGAAALTGTTTTVTSWEYLNGTYSVNHSTAWPGGYEAWRGFTSASITNPWVSANNTYHTATGAYASNAASWIDNNSTFVPGEWCAVELPAARQVSAVTIYRQLNGEELPGRIAVLVGQSSGTMTVAVDVDNIPNATSHTLSFTAGSYEYIRLVAIKTRAPLTYCTFSFLLTTTTAGFPLSIDHAQVKIASTEDSVSALSGALQIAGGVGVAGSLQVGGVVGIAKSLFVGDANGIRLAAVDNAFITKGWDAFTSGKYNTLGRWGLYMEPGWTTIGGAKMTPTGTRGVQIVGYNVDSTYNPWLQVYTDTGVVVINSVTEATSTTSGALQVAGGLSVQKSINIGTATIPCGLNHEVGSTTPLLNLGINFRPTNNTVYGEAQFRIDARGFGTNGTPFYWFTRPPGSSTESAIATLDMTGKLALNGGLLNLTNGTSNLIHYSTAGVLPPTSSTRSPGTKIVLYPEVSGIAVDYAIGMEGGHVWCSVPSTNATTGFKWYGGTTQIARLDGVGNMQVNGSIDEKVPRFFYSDNVTLANYQTLAANTEKVIQLYPSSTYTKGPQPDANYALVIPTAGLWHFDLNMTITGFVGANNWFLQLNVAGTTQSTNIHRSFGQSNISAQFPNVYALVTGSIYLTLPAGAVVTMGFQPSVQCHTGNGCLARFAGRLIAAS
ncbi:TPA_asm: fiber [Powellomyces chytrid fungus MELD virus 3]|nr:TPA_asm: fiber [Powellomyces chytrid fungus MELD virus 3]